MELYLRSSYIPSSWRAQRQVYRQIHRLIYPAIYLQIKIERHRFSQNHSFVTRLFYTSTSILHMEAVFSFEIFVFSYRTARYHNTVDYNMLYTRTYDRLKQQRSEVVYLKKSDFILFWPEFRIVGPCHISNLHVSGYLCALFNNAVTISYVKPPNNQTHKWTRNSEEYRSDRDVPGWTEEYHDTRLKEARFLFEIWTRELPSQWQWSLLDCGVRYTTRNACHETQCEEAARHRHQLHATDVLQIMYDWCGNYKRLCQHGEEYKQVNTSFE
jgi:hypothetical protein